MSHSYQWGVLVGILIGLVIIAVVFAYNKKKTGSVNGGEYDERQKLMRGRAFQKGFFTMMIFSFVYWALVQLILQKPLMEDGLSGLVCLFAGVGVFGVDSILHDAFFTVRNKPMSYILLFAVCTLAQVPAMISNLHDGSMVTDGVLTFRILPLVAAVTFLGILCAIVIKQALPQKDED